MGKLRPAQILALHKSGKKAYSGSTLKNAAKKVGAMGGAVGGPARADALAPETRTEIARHAANKRWGVPCNCRYC